MVRPSMIYGSEYCSVYNTIEQKNKCSGVIMLMWITIERCKKRIEYKTIFNICRRYKIKCNRGLIFTEEIDQSNKISKTNSCWDGKDHKYVIECGI